MGELKPGWKKWRFEEFAEKISIRVNPNPEDTATYIGLEHLDSGSLTVRRWGSQTELKGTKFQMCKGDILFARRNAYLRRVAVAPHDGLFSAHGLVLRPKPNVVLPALLPFFMQSDIFMDRAQRISVGSLSPTINWKTLAKQEFALPPIEKQQQLVRLLLSIEQRLEAGVKLETKREVLLKAYREHYFQANQGRFDGIWTQIKESALLVTKGQSPRWQGFEYQDAGFRFITSENVRIERVSMHPEKFVPLAFGEKLARSAIQSGDVLINIVGGSIGRIAVAPHGLGPTATNQAVAVVRVDPKKLIPDFLVSYLMTPSVNHRFCNRSVDDYKPNLSLTSIREYKIPLAALNEQEEHCAVLAELKGGGKQAQQRLEATKALKTKVLEQLVGS